LVGSDVEYGWMPAGGQRIGIWFSVRGMMMCSQVHGSVEAELGDWRGPGAGERAEAT
jgi:hypothetical protein